MATGMHTDERSVDCLVLGHHDQDWIVSAKSVTMRAMTLCKNLSGYRELLFKANILWRSIKKTFTCLGPIAEHQAGFIGYLGCYVIDL